VDGPTHYREAERYLMLAEQADAGSSGAQTLLAKAQAHATLAVAAATALSSESSWHAVMAAPDA
jgi:hypothetical protein